jgi:hypothetical protein
MENPRVEKFRQMKKLYPQYLCGIDVNGNLISIEKPGKICLQMLKNIEVQDISNHIIFVHEFIWQHIQPPSGKLISILDFEGFKFSNIYSTHFRSLIMTSSKVLETKYPDRTEKIILINMPWFVSKVLNLLYVLLPNIVEKKIVICSDVKELQEFIDINIIPVEYAGKCLYKLDEYTEEKQLNEYVLS